jgi:hypothetical protein
MASFTDLVVNGLLQFGQGQGALNATGLRCVPPSVAQADLTADVNNLVLSEFDSDGPLFFSLVATSAGLQVTGIQAVTLGIQPGQVVIVFNGGTNTIEFPADDAGSTVGNRFTADFEIEPGTSAIIVYAGATLGWSPVLAKSIPD